MKKLALVAIYLISIVAANLLVTLYGPSISILLGFVFIGLNLSTRDKLHDLWARNVGRNMGLLIVAGGVISYALNAGAGRIAIASVAAFALSETVDALAYQAAHRRPYLVRSNFSNLFGASVDSIAFPVLAFGGFPILIILGQFAAKMAGGFLWSLILNYHRQRTAARA